MSFVNIFTLTLNGVSLCRSRETNINNLHYTRFYLLALRLVSLHFLLSDPLDQLIPRTFSLQRLLTSLTSRHSVILMTLFFKDSFQRLQEFVSNLTMSQPLSLELSMSPEYDTTWKPPNFAVLKRSYDMAIAEEVEATNKRRKIEAQKPCQDDSQYRAEDDPMAG